MKRQISIVDAMADKHLLGAALGDPLTWTTWMAVLAAAFGLPLTDEQLQIFKDVAGGRAPPQQRVRELWAIVGRRGGKSRIAAAIAIFLAIFCKYKLAPGETGMVLVLSASAEQSKVVFAYAAAFLTTSLVLRQEVESITRGEIRLRNGIVIAIHSNSFRTIRGRTLCACVFDEVAIWRDEASATPDVEVYRAVLPALITTGGMLIGISTGYRRIGLLYDKHRNYFGVASADTLVVQGGTLQFNTTLDAAAIAAQQAADPAASATEWSSGFRDDIAGYLDDELIEAAIEYGRPPELPPRPGYTSYMCFVDSAGGVGGDSYTISIGHKEAEHFVIDLVRGTSGKFDPAAVTRDYAALVKEYKCSSVSGDFYGAEWVGVAWRDCNVSYIRSELNKSQIYLETIPLFARRLVRLPEHRTLLRELRLLERRTHSGGKDVVDHPRGGRDDYANAACGVLRKLSNYLGYDQTYAGFNDGPHDPDGAREWQALRFNQFLRRYAGMP